MSSACAWKHTVTSRHKAQLVRAHRGDAAGKDEDVVADGRGARALLRVGGPEAPEQAAVHVVPVDVDRAVELRRCGRTLALKHMQLILSGTVDKKQTTSLATRSHSEDKTCSLGATALLDAPHPRM